MNHTTGKPWGIRFGEKEEVFSKCSEVIPTLGHSTKSGIND